MKITSITVGDFADMEQAKLLVAFVDGQRLHVQNAEGEDGDDADADTSTEDGVADKGSGRKARRRGKRSDAVGGGSSPRKGRRSRALPATDEGGDGEGQEDVAKPASGRRGRRRGAGASDAGAGGDTETEPRESPKSRGRGRGRKKAAPSAEATDETISDNTLSKAASRAALVILPVGVKEVMAEFGVEDVADLEQDVRREFLDNLADRMTEEDR